MSPMDAAVMYRSEAARPTHPAHEGGGDQGCEAAERGRDLVAE